MGETLRMLRPDDLLLLEVELVGLGVVRTPRGAVLAVADEGQPEGQPRLLVFRLPPQHLAEEAYYDSSPEGCGPPEKFLASGSQPPDAAGLSSSRLASPSRLVFSVPPQLLPLPLTFDALLAWHRFDLVVPPASRAGAQDAPPIMPPLAHETALELPWRLWLSPEQGSAWSTTDSATSRAGRTELWRGVLGVVDGEAFRPADQSGTVPVRAVWSPDWRPSDRPWLQDPARGVPFLSSLQPGDRHQLVVLTSGFAGYVKGRFDAVAGSPSAVEEVTVEGPLRRWLGDTVVRRVSRPYRPVPAQASRLWVSALGASLRSTGSWESVDAATGDVLDDVRALLEDAISKLGPPGARLVADGLRLDSPERDRILADVLDLHGQQVFAQLATQADVDLVHRPRGPGGESTDLSYWSHDAVFGRDQRVVVAEEGALFPFGHRAVHVTVTERRIERTTAAGGVPVANLYQYSYVSVRQRVRTLPLTAPQARAFPFGDRLELLTTVTPHLSRPEDSEIAPGAFWVKVAAGSTSVPLLFSCAGLDAAGGRFTFTTPLVFVRLALWRDAAALAAVAAGYSKASPAANVGNQPVALATARASGSRETTVVVDAMTLRADAGANGPDTWIPEVAEAAVQVPDIARISGPEHAGRSIRFDANYVSHGLVGQGIWAAVMPSPGGLAGLGLTAGASGGVAVPEFAPSALSRELGPTVASAVGAGFDPAAFFPDTATLFGVLKLKDLVNPGDPGMQAPTLTSRLEPSGTLADAVVTELAWAPSISGPTIHLPMVEVDRSGAGLAVRATIRRSLTGGRGATTVAGVVRDLTITIAGAVEVGIDAFRFASADGAGADVDVHLGHIDFVGPLAFLAAVQEKLQEFSSLLGGPGGPKISVDGVSVKVEESIALPPFPLAVFALHDVRLSTGVLLPLVDGRPSLRFAVAERHHPFVLTISLLGGGGYLELEIDTEGIKALDAALEFGGEFQLDIGVASGGVRIMAGFYFTYDRAKPSAVLGGFFEASGFVSVLGIVTVSVVFRLELGYDLTRNKIHGSAEVIVSVSIIAVSKSVTMTVERSFGVDGGDPDFAMLVAPSDWDEYAEAFA
ncbi:hypothetical protein ND748_09950 [Frankia sp. AiPs1]|uniref:hypothetical protein n=1 Tax=Frankia sp. AiPs1 TaxID=573493 RepID=UPI0020447765|nr:hypothetical protein [Frankia sp. AiPs1]MCM3921980.1 hypothetical protein [Frankia sp. AiPs1]